MGTYVLPEAALINVNAEGEAYLQMLLRSSKRKPDNSGFEYKKIAGVGLDPESLAKFDLFCRTTKFQNAEYCVTGVLSITDGYELSNIEFHKSLYVKKVQTTLQFNGQELQQESLVICYRQTESLRISPDGRVSRFLDGRRIVNYNFHASLVSDTFRKAEKAGSFFQIQQEGKQVAYFTRTNNGEFAAVASEIEAFVQRRPQPTL
jgi:hypothetical protein